MSALNRTLSLLLGLLLTGGVILAERPVSAAPANTQPADRSGPVAQRSAASDTSNTPSFEPYATNRSLAYHVLATPAYILHAVTRPIGWGVKFVEQEYPGVFEPRRPPRGILPLVELGGPTGFLAGVALYDNHLFGSDHRARIEGLYGGPNTFDGVALYELPTHFGPRTSAQILANFFSDPKNEFYVGGNDSDRTADEAFFSRDQLDVTVGVRTSSADERLSGGVDLLYEHVTAETGDDVQGQRLDAANPPGLGTVDLFTSRLLLGLDLTEGRPRTYWGTEVLLQLDYTHDLHADRFRYGRYVAEVRQYLPVGFFPNSRRLALRGRLEQVEPLFEGLAVPFYQLPSLGGRRMLRGFRTNRFQNDGSLLFAAEYRYPLWSNLDAVLLVDAGQVFNELSDVAADRFRWSYGGGLHLLNQKGISFRFEVVGGTEGVRTVLTVEPSFQRVVR